MNKQEKIGILIVVMIMSIGIFAGGFKLGIYSEAQEHESYALINEPITIIKKYEENGMYYIEYLVQYDTFSSTNSSFVEVQRGLITHRLSKNKYDSLKIDKTYNGTFYISSNVIGSLLSIDTKPIYDN
jgi:hypothetical protein